MHRRSERVALELGVELYVAGEARRASLRDLSRTGMFLKLSPPLPVGEHVHVALFYEGRQLASPAIVVHELDDANAVALGRRPGNGVRFATPTRHADQLFMRAVDRILASRARATPPALHVVVADSSTRLLERLSSELGDAGCTVAIATNGLEAMGACLRRVPDAVVVDRALPGLDGLQLVSALARKETLANVPVIVMTGDADEILAAFDRGAKDVIHKPFTGVELAARCRHLAQLAKRPMARVIMRGDLEQMSLAALLVMLEQERKSCRILLTGAYPAWIELQSGSIVAAGSAAHGDDVQTIVSALLDWPTGDFELISATAPTRYPRATTPITFILLEHARRTDERNRRN